MTVPVMQESFCGLKAWRLNAPDGSTALVAEQGATLLSWRPLGGDEVIDGYVDADELMEHADGRSLIMVPWCGKIASGRYVFEGREVSLPPALAERTGLGALAADVAFTRRNAGDALILVGTIAASEAYPWDLEVSVVFALEAGAGSDAHLSVTIDVRNLSGTRAPVCLGWLPFVRLPGRRGISNLSVFVPARTKILSADGVPLNGDAAYGGIQSPERIGYIGAQVIERGYTNLVPDENGVVKTIVSDPVSGKSMELTQEPSEAPVVYLSTGDGFLRDSRNAIAVGPCSAMANAFNRADEAARLALEPGDMRSLTSTLTYRA